jgi:hypothetical protein
MAKIAGHDFGPDGYCMLPKNDGEKCWMRLSDISCVTKDAIGKVGWSHSSTLNEREFMEIIQAVERIYSAHVAARGE